MHPTRRQGQPTTECVPPVITKSSGVMSVVRPTARRIGRSGVRDMLLHFLTADVPSDAHRLVALCRSLLDARVLHISDPHEEHVFLEEAEAGVLALPLRQDAALATRPMRAAAERMVETARPQLLRAYRGLLREPRNDQFVHEAMYLGRVEIVQRGPSSAFWTPVLCEGQLVSDWLLALLATDIWTNPQLYRSGLSVCDACDVVTLDLSHHQTDRCVRHADIPDDELFAKRDLPTRPDIKGSLVG